MSETPTSEMRCSQCGYDLRGLESRQCPECGEAFDPCDEATFLTSPASGFRVFVKLFGGLSFLLIPLLYVSWKLSVGDGYFTLPLCLGPISIVFGFVLCCLCVGDAWDVLNARHGWVVHRGLAKIALGLSGVVVGGVMIVVIWRVLTVLTRG